MAGDFVKLTVGRIVHFFTEDTRIHSSEQGKGPYAALVVQVYDQDAPQRLATLRVFKGNGRDETFSSVAHEDYAKKNGYNGWWTYPPRS